MPSMLAYVIFFCGFLNVALNLVTIVVLVIRKRQDSSKPLHKRRRTPELKLFIIALIGCFNILLEVALFVSFTTNTPTIGVATRTLRAATFSRADTFRAG